MAWQKIVLTKDRKISAETDKIMGAFMKTCESSTVPEDAALFSEFHADDGSKTIWMTPAACTALGEALSSYAPVACEQPNISDIALLVGSARAWSSFE